VDLLARLLAFDPTRRCSPEEALAHEYFADTSTGEAGAGAAHCLRLCAALCRLCCGHDVTPWQRGKVLLLAAWEGSPSLPH
jgi:hypothetical protein